jgi:hypothetical protein
MPGASGARLPAMAIGRGTMTHVDSAILNLTEWFCRRFQLLTGRTNVWLAVQLTNLSIIMYFVWAGVSFWRSGGAARLALALFCAGLMYVLTQTIFKVPIEAYENDAYRRVAKGLRNPRRLQDARLRIPFLTLSCVLFYPILFAYMNLRLPTALLTYSLIVLTTIVLYLLACDPLPPCAGKLREWLQGAAPAGLADARPPDGRGPRQRVRTSFGRSASVRTRPEDPAGISTPISVASVGARSFSATGAAYSPGLMRGPIRINGMCAS